MKATVDALKELEFPRARRHQEKFVSLGGNPFGEPVAEALDHVVAEAEPDSVPGPAQGPTALEVELDGTTYTFDDWPADTTMLRHLESKGVKAPYSCEEGECSACAFRLLSGDVKMLKNDVLDEEDLADGLRLACQALPTSDSVKATYH